MVGRFLAQPPIPYLSATSGNDQRGALIPLSEYKIARSGLMPGWPLAWDDICQCDCSGHHPRIGTTHYHTLITRFHPTSGPHNPQSVRWTFPSELNPAVIWIWVTRPTLCLVRLRQALLWSPQRIERLAATTGMNIFQNLPRLIGEKLPSFLESGEELDEIQFRMGFCDLGWGSVNYLE